MRRINDILGPIAVGSLWFFICLSVLGLRHIHCPLWLSIAIGIPAGSFLGVVFVGLFLRLLLLVIRKKASSTEPDLESGNAGVNLIEGIIIPLVGLLIFTAMLFPVIEKIQQNAKRQHHMVQQAHPVVSQ